MSAPAPADAFEPVPSTSTSDAPVGTKRKADSDLTQPADKKTKTMRQSEPDSGLHPSPSSGVLSQIASRFTAPFPVATSQYVTVDTANMASYFSSLFNALVTVIYPDSTYEPQNMITIDQFVLVCRYLTKARIDHVYSAASGRRPPSRIAIPRDFEVPKSLADVINGIGTVLINGAAFNVIPQPEADPQDPAQRLTNRVSFDILQSFAALVAAALARGFIRTGFISSVPEGTAWWLLTARTPANPTVIANDSDAANVYGVFKEWTPSDGVICAIVQRQNDGLFPDMLVALMWSFDTVRGIAGLRRTFNLRA